MAWEEIAARLAEIGIDILDSMYEDIIAAAGIDPSSELKLTEAQIQEIVDAAEAANNELDSAVVGSFNGLADEGYEFDSYSTVISFFIAKQVTDGIRSIHGATIAKQLLEPDRPEAQLSALQRAKDRIEFASLSESSSSFALKHQSLAIDLDFFYFKYHTSEDDVVRDQHKSRNGKIFVYGNERVSDDVPGLANNCRCFSEPLDLEEALAGEFFYPQDRPSNPRAESKRENMKKKPMFKIQSLANVVTIDIQGVIDLWDNNDYESFSQKVNAYLENDSQELVLNVTSYGGNGSDSMNAYNLLKSIPNKVTANIYGYAGSAATHFVVAADHATIGELDEFFIHQAWTCPCGNKEELLKTVETLRDFDDQQIEIYMAKTGMNREDTEELLNAERVISAQESFDLGFIDEIRPDSNRSKSARGEVSAQANYSALIKAHKPTSKIEEPPMKLEDIFAFLKGASDSDKAELLAKLDGVAKADSDAAVATVQAQLDAANTTIDAKESIINAAKKSASQEDDKTARETLRAELKAELDAEGKAIAKISAEVKKAGLDVDGETSADIMASALEQAGASSKDSAGNQFSSEVMSNIWASIVTVRGQDHNDSEIHALGGEVTGSDKSERPAGSRASRINK